MPAAETSFHETGLVTDKISVEISLQIIGLFSEGLYSNPNKAIEELVSNAFDADATHVHVVVPADRASADASIAVIDDGTGMDQHGLKVHWIVGDSRKSRNRVTANGRRTIGKFGIGKLAAYVIGNRLTHITKSNGKYYSTSMDFSTLQRTVDVDHVSKPEDAKPATAVTLDLRELSAAEAKAALRPWLSSTAGRKELRLFGASAAKSWTAAIISDLKPMALDLSPGKLRWVLSTAMPLRDDFALYLNDHKVASSKLVAKRVGHWVVGNHIKPGSMESDTDSAIKAPAYRHWFAIDKLLGPVTGYVEMYQSPIDTGKSTEVGRSNGFFVYVHERLINPDDGGFGIDRNLLRHGTFSRLRVVVNIDRLDEELRSSRESLRDGPMLIRAREVLKELFNFARTKLEVYENSTTTERKASQRLSESPASVTERPIIRMLLDAYDGVYTPRHLVATDTDRFKTREDLLAHVEARIDDRAGLVTDVSFNELGTQMPMSILDVASGELSINLEHPFVAYFSDEFDDKKKNLPLQLFAIAEILLEASLHDAGVTSEAMTLVLDSRDSLLRHLAKSTGAQNSLTVAQDLVASASSAKGLETALVAAFNQLGFEAIPKAKKDEADGLAEAFLPARSDGVRHYRVSLEAKSKESPGGKVKKKAVEVSTIARHRREANCDHAIVVGPEFETGDKDWGAVMREIADDRAKNSGKTITLMRISDLARLVRIAPLKRTNLAELRELFVSASSPAESAAWVDNLDAMAVKAAPYAAILDALYALQQDDKIHRIDYSALRTYLRVGAKKKVTLTDDELKTECLALGRMAPNLFFAGDTHVELNTHPSKVLKLVHNYVELLPVENQA